MISLKLLIEDGLLSVECEYPSEQDINELPRVWLTRNKFSWNRDIFENEKHKTIPICWDGILEFQEAKHVTTCVKENSTNFESYCLSSEIFFDFMTKTLGYLTKDSMQHQDFQRNMGKSRTPQLNVPRIAENFCYRYVIFFHRSTRRNYLCKNIYGTKSKYTQMFGLKLKIKVTQSTI